MKKRPVHISIIDEHEKRASVIESCVHASLDTCLLIIHHFNSRQECLADDIGAHSIIITSENDCEALDLYRVKWPNVKLIVITTEDEHSIFNRSFLHGADYVLLNDQRIFQKLKRTLSGLQMSIHERHDSGLLHILEKGLGIDERKRMAIIEPEGQSLFDLHYRLTRTLDMNIDAYKSVDGFFSNFVYFPDLILISKRALGPNDSSSIRRMKNLGPGTRIILLSEDQFHSQEVEELLRSGVDKMIDREPSSMDGLERLILSAY